MKRIECCGECGARKIVYKRAIRAPEVEMLKRLVELGVPSKSTGIPNMDIARHADFCRLQLWGLIAAVSTLLWEVTPKGLEWLQGGTKIPKFLWVYRNQVLEDREPKAPLISVSEVIYKKRNKPIVLAEAQSH